MIGETGIALVAVGALTTAFGCGLLQGARTNGAGRSTTTGRLVIGIGLLCAAVGGVLSWLGR